jgi:cell division protein FtsZ
VIDEALYTADSILNQATSGISDLITQTGIINLDFADIKTIMQNMGDAVVGTAEASGPSRAVMAASMAISSPLLDNVSIKGARGILINFTGGPDMKLSEIHEASEIIHQEAGEESDSNIIFGMIVDENLSDVIRVTVIATGFNQEAMSQKIEHPQPDVPKPSVRVDPPQNTQTDILNKDPMEKKEKRKETETHSTERVQEELFTAFTSSDPDDKETPTWIRKQKYLSK